MKRLALLLLLAAAGCGQSGDLFIPAETEPEAEAAPAEPADEEEDGEEKEETGPR